MRTLIIHNPKSGFGSDAIFEFERALLSPGDKCDFLMTDEDFSASEVVSGAVDYDLVVVSGGDGTVASLLYALRGTGVPTCIFPSGTANLLYANLGNAPEPASLARACRIGETTPIDLGEISWFDERGLRSTRGFALMAGTVLVNITPFNPYSVAALTAWRQGHFFNFNGLTRLTAANSSFLSRMAFLSLSVGITAL